MFSTWCVVGMDQPTKNLKQKLNCFLWENKRNTMKKCSLWCI